MGLDQYLYGRKYLSAFDEKDIKIIEKISALFDIKLEYRESDMDLTVESGEGFTTLSPKKTEKKKVLEFNSFYPQQLFFEVAYWRKANQIHAWFVKNCQEGVDNCAKYFVSDNDIQNLIDTIIKVLDDHSLAEELLPNQNGFFFGNVDYDDWYFEDLKDTKEKLEDILTNEKYRGLEFFYQSSW